MTDQHYLEDGAGKASETIPAPPLLGGAVLASIIVPAHNAEPFLRDAVRSALSQSVRDIEVLVVDDASTDGTWEVARRLAEADSRVVPLRRARRGGVSVARNDALARARGRWIAVLDADDMFLPRRVERLATLAEAEGADLIADNLLQRDLGSGADLGYLFPPQSMTAPAPLTLNDLVQRDMPDLPGRAGLGYVKPMLRRSFLEASGTSYAPGMAAGEDFLLLFECVARGGRFHLASEAHYVYRRRQDSASRPASTAPHYSEANRRMLAIAASLGDEALLRLLRRRQTLLDYSAFVHSMEERRFLHALRYAHGGSRDHVLAQLRVAKRALLTGTGGSASRA
jgi:glycosyltransferase involved in cell wall biosynthesis